MKLSHAGLSASVVFDEPNLMSLGGLVPVVKLAQDAGLRDLADTYLSVPRDRGANAGLKVMSLVAGMVAGADSIDDMAVLRHGGMRRMFEFAYAPSTLGSFLREFRFGHVRQLDAVASRFLAGLARQAPIIAGSGGPGGSGSTGGYRFLDVDDTIIEVHGYSKQGSGYGYSGVRGLNALIATVSTTQTAPVIVAQRLRKGAANSARGAARIVADALATLKRLPVNVVEAAPTTPAAPAVRTLLRADSAFYGRPGIAAAIKGGAHVSVTVRMDPRIKAAITTITADAWTTIEYTDAVFDETTNRWVSRAEVAEIPFTAFGSKSKAEQIPGRLVVRRIPDLNPSKGSGQPTLFDVDTWRFHAFFTTSDLDTVTADKTHRQHAIIEQVHADLKNSALAHLPSAAMCANAAWLVLAVMAFNLTRTAAVTISGPKLAKATTGTIRRKLIHLPARIARSGRRLKLHLPTGWPWQSAFTQLDLRLRGT